MNLTSRQLYTRLLRHVLPYRGTFALGVLAMVVLAATEPAIPALLKPTFDGSFVEKDLSSVGLMAGLLVLVFLVRGLGSVVSALALAAVAGKLVMDLRCQMFDKLVALPASFYDEHAPGELISKITFDSAQVTEAATQVVTVLVRDTLAILGLLAWMLYLDWKLTLVACAAGPVVVLIVKYFSKRLRRMSHELQRAMGNVTHVVEEAIEGQRVIRTFGAQGYERGRFSAAANWARRYQVKFVAAAASNSPLAQLVAAIALATILYLAAHQSAAGELSIGSFVSFFAAMGMLFSPLKRITGVNGSLQRGLAAASSVFALVDRPSEPDAGTRVLGAVEGRLEFAGVSFRYGDDVAAWAEGSGDVEAAPGGALRGIDLTIEPGETVALVGPSGSGKTTLAALVPRFYEPDAGRVLVDGIDISTVALTSLREQIALVSQDIVLFDDTVAANIAYGRDTVGDRARIERAAHAASAMEFISSLPDGFDSRIGARGSRLSGGERQRLAIARAFYKDAPILILDEATSALDAASEDHIKRALEKLRDGRTTIIIAHRLSTIESADRIALLSEGQVIDVGDHRTLFETNSLYAGLCRFQFNQPTPTARAAV